MAKKQYKRRWKKKQYVGYTQQKRPRTYDIEYKGTYQEYLQTDYWKQLRKYTLEKNGNICSKCGRKKYLQVHHLRYKRGGKSVLFREKDVDLIVLCSICHSKEHKIEGLIYT